MQRRCQQQNANICNYKLIDNWGIGYNDSKEEIMSSADTIKKIRISLCLNHKEFADLLGVSAASISLYEKGERKPRFPIIRKLIELAKKQKISVTVEDFLSD